MQVGEITPGAPPKEALYEEAKEYDAYKDIRAIVKEAKEELIVIDPYVDSSLLGLFENAASSVSICVLTWNMKGDFQLAAEKFKSQRGAVEIRVRQGEFHDRFIIADSKCFHLGASIKNAGKRVFMISRIEDALNIQALRQVFNKSWNDATVVV